MLTYSNINNNFILKYLKMTPSKNNQFHNIYWALPRDTNNDHNPYHKKKHKKNQVVVPNIFFISPY